MERKQCFVTTPIYYVNGDPHVGHAHTTVMGDIFRRAMKMRGVPVFYTTGVDEHGQKNSMEIESSGMTAGQYLDRQSRKFKDLFALLNIEYDFFVRTSRSEHKKAVEVFLRKLYDTGQIIKKEYAGLYCSGCEQFKTDSDLDEEGKCPDHHVKPAEEKETNYFFPLEPYRAWLAEYIRGNSCWINPESYRNKVLDMLAGPLPDLCVSRPKSRVPLGIELPFDRDFVVYVWFDALINYISSIGYPDTGREFRERWKNSFHLMAKDIIKTHCIYWPVMLRAAGLEPANANFIHGFWVGEDGRKMAKSLGNGVDPAELVERYGADPLRAYLAAKISRNESRIGETLFRNYYNSFFANMLGNVYLRSGKLLEKYTCGVIPESDPDSDDLEFLCRLVSAAEEHSIAEISFERISVLMDGLEFIGAELNKYINDTKPWTLDKNSDARKLNSILRTCMEGIRVLFEAGWPVIPGTAEKVLGILGCRVPGDSGNHSFVPLSLEPGREIAKTEMLFPRLADDQV